MQLIVLYMLKCVPHMKKYGKTLMKKNIKNILHHTSTVFILENENRYACSPYPSSSY